MLVECIVIFGIIGSVILMTLKYGKKDAAVQTVPLLIVPFMYIAANYLSVPLAGILPMNKFAVFTSLIIVSAIISSVFVGYYTNRFNKKSTKAAYSIMCMSFIIILSGVLIFNLYKTIY